MTKKTVLIIDDDNDLRELYKSVLADSGFHVLTANNGIDGLERVRILRPNLVLLDLMMPQKNGFDVLKEIKNDPELKKIKVIILSSLGHESDIKYTTELKADGYLVKSVISLKDLTARVTKELE